MRLESLLQTLQKRQFLPSESRKHGLPHEPQLLVEYAVEELFLRAEIVVQQSVRYARRLGDRRGARTGESLGEKFAFGRLQNRLLSVQL